MGESKLEELLRRKKKKAETRIPLKKFLGDLSLLKNGKVFFPSSSFFSEQEPGIKNYISLNNKHLRLFEGPRLKKIVKIAKRANPKKYGALKKKCMKDMKNKASVSLGFLDGWEEKHSDLSTIVFEVMPDWVEMESQNKTGVLNKIKKEVGRKLNRYRRLDVDFAGLDNLEEKLKDKNPPIWRNLKGKVRSASENRISSETISRGFLYKEDNLYTLSKEHNTEKEGISRLKLNNQSFYLKDKFNSKLLNDVLRESLKNRIMEEEKEKIGEVKEIMKEKGKEFFPVLKYLMKEKSFKTENFGFFEEGNDFIIYRKVKGPYVLKKENKHKKDQYLKFDSCKVGVKLNSPGKVHGPFVMEQRGEKRGYSHPFVWERGEICIHNLNQKYKGKKVSDKISGYLDDSGIVLKHSYRPEGYSNSKINPVKSLELEEFEDNQISESMLDVKNLNVTNKVKEDGRR